MICICKHITKMVERLETILSTAYGWIIAAFSVAVNFLSGYEHSVLAVVICVALDTAWGISAQVKQHRFTTSELGRNGMLSKWAFYGSAIVGFIVIDKLIGAEGHITVTIICSMICLVELWSMSGSALIINPNMPFLRLFRHALSGEIARKMDRPVEEVEDMFNEKKEGKE